MLQRDNDVLLEMAHDIQDTYGYIPEREITNLAEKFSEPRAKIYGALEFYSMFYTEPTGKYIIRLCDSISCYLNDSSEVLTAVQDYLGLESGETSEDKMFTLEVVECLGHCGEGPVMMVNDKMYTEMSPGRALDILSECQ